MRNDVLLLILGWTLVVFTAPLVLCGLLTIWLDDMQIGLQAFGPAAGISLGLGAMMLMFGTNKETSSRMRDVEAFVGVGLVWPIAVFIGALPLWLGDVFYGPLNAGATTDQIITGAVHAWFESMSGFTTTGSTVISHSTSPMCDATTVDCINAQHKGLLLWRSLIQWFGGMGIIMLGMMLLSRVLGGGAALARAELTGPSLSKLAPKLRETARALWGIYFFLTLIEFLLLYFVGGMSSFDAINHALTTLPTGGFSTRDASIGYYDSPMIEGIIVLFMFLAGVNFTLLWFARKGDIRFLVKDEEFRNYLLYILIAFLIVLVALIQTSELSLFQAARDGIFQVVSLGTSTGYASTDYMPWPVVTHVLIFMLMIIGASAGSTGGGLKLMRITLGFKLALIELKKIAQPRKIHRIRLNKEVVEDNQLSLIIGMMIIWVILFGVSSLILAVLMPNETFESIVSIVASSLGNTGPALGDFGTNPWHTMNNPSLVITSVLMWFGRLELITAIILLHPHTWRREEKPDGDVQAIAMIKRLVSERKE